MSFDKAMESYVQRVKANLQPTIGSESIINFFDISHQYTCLIVANILYLAITIFLFMHMKTKVKAYRLRWVLVIYDAVNVLITAYISYSIIFYKLKNGLLICNSVMNDAEGHRIARVFLLFYLQKYLEFFDTWFFILRKSFRQVSEEYYSEKSLIISHGTTS